MSVVQFVGKSRLSVAALVRTITAAIYVPGFLMLNLIASEILFDWNTTQPSSMTMYSVPLVICLIAIGCVLTVMLFAVAVAMIIPLSRKAKTDFCPVAKLGLEIGFELIRVVRLATG